VLAKLQYGQPDRYNAAPPGQPDPSLRSLLRELPLPDIPLSKPSPSNVSADSVPGKAVISEPLSTPDAQAPRAKGRRLGSLVHMRQFLAPYRVRLVLALLALALTATVTLSIGQGLRLLVDSGVVQGRAGALDEALIAFMVLVLLLAGGTFVRFYLVSWLGERVAADMRRAVFDRVINLHPAFFEQNSAGEIQSRITTDTTLLQTVIGSSVSVALRNLLMFVGGLFWMGITNFKLTSIVLLAVPVVVVPILIYGRRVRSLARVSQDRIADAGSYINESLGSIKTVIAFNQQASTARRFANHSELAFDVAVSRITQRAWLTVIVIVLVMSAIGGMLWVGGNDVLRGEITGGELAAFVFYAVMVAGSVGAISEVYGDLQRAAGATERLLELLQITSDLPVPAQPRPIAQPARGEIRIEQLTFNYASRPEHPAIRELTLFINAGERVALVGASGAGKSTLFDLLLRFYDPQQGRILWDGIDLRELDPLDLRSHIAIVPQQPILFRGSVSDNIRYGRVDASDADVIAAAKLAYAHEFIEQLPQGYDSELGEGGMRLSGGQRQRIAIARAILKDPELLLLDEATSALDAESEFQVQQALEQLMKNRTTLVIAHRLATVIDVDRILVLDQGQLVDSGNHETLIKSSPLYARWAQLQFDDSARSFKNL
jgi:ATP-binding cassette, subfamily B, bacterial